MTPDLAEFLGAMLGDGNVFLKNGKGHITITSNMHTDFPYLKLRLLPLVKKIFAVEAKIYSYPKRENVARLRINSKAAIIELIRFLPIGKKIGKMKIPERLWSNKDLLASFVRGFFDTDGTIFQKYGKYAQIEFRTYDKKFKVELVRAIKHLGFNPSVNRNHNSVCIHRQEEIHMFFRSVGSANPKHILRYKIWSKSGNVPRIEEVPELIKNFKGKLPYTG